MQRDPIGDDNRRLFEQWGLKRVKQMMAAGHFEEELRRPMAKWIAERQSSRVRLVWVAVLAGLILAALLLFSALLVGANG